MQIIPLAAIPSQTLTIVLNNQECIIHVHQRTTGLYLDLYILGALVLSGVAARDRTLMVMNSYLGFVGDLMFIDTAGTADPNYSGLGTEWFLVYLLPSEVASPASVIPFWTPSTTPPPTQTPTPVAPSAPGGVVIS